MGKILVVDDEPAVRDVMAIYFTRFGHESLTAEDGKSALGLIEMECPDIVVLDFFLPDMVALELISQLAVLRPRLPVIMITSFWNRAYVQYALEGGASDYVPKPIDFVGLLETVECRLRQQSYN